jgi:rare lipoprotein A
MDKTTLPGLAACMAAAVMALATSAQAAQGDKLPEVQRQTGKASYYAKFFAGRKMANGEPMRPESNNAASRTLPLGTTAIVTNLENGRSAEVEIKDRGPYVNGRIIDVSPGTARELGMLEDGVVRVEVVPLSIPSRRD